MLKLLKECNKYSVNTYTLVEISLNTCRNTLDFMCNLELFSKIRSHTYKDFLYGYADQLLLLLLLLLLMNYRIEGIRLPVKT